MAGSAIAHAAGGVVDIVMDRAAVVLVVAGDVSENPRVSRVIARVGVGGAAQGLFLHASSQMVTGPSLAISTSM